MKIHIDNENSIDFSNIYGVRKLINAYDTSQINEYEDLFETIMEDFYYVDLNADVNYIAIKEFNILEDHIYNNILNISETIGDINSEGLFILIAENKKTNKINLISNGEVVIYKNQEGTVDTIPMNGSNFEFKGQTYTASLEGLKMLEIIHYNSDLIVKDNLTNKPEPEPKQEIKSVNKIKNNR